MKLIKYIWGIRALFSKPFYKHIGHMSYIGKPLYIDGKKNISIGDRVRIFPGIRMEAIGDGKIVIGNNVVIEQNAHIISGGGTLVIGDNVTIAPNVFITNTNHEYRDVNRSVMDQGLIVSDTAVGEGCFLGFGSAVQAGTHLGKHCIVGSNSVVKGNFQDNVVIVGAPGRIIKQYNEQLQKWE